MSANRPALGFWDRARTRKRYHRNALAATNPRKMMRFVKCWPFIRSRNRVPANSKPPVIVRGADGIRAIEASPVVDGEEYGFSSTMVFAASDNGRFLRNRFSTKPKVIATQNSLPKRNRVAKEVVSAARQTKTRQRSERIGKPNDAPMTKPRPCVKTMLGDRRATICVATRV